MIEVLKRQGNITLKRIKGISCHLCVEVRDDKGKMRMCGGKPANWSFPSNDLGMRLALEQFVRAVGGSYGTYCSRYSKELEVLSRKLRNDYRY